MNKLVYTEENDLRTYESMPDADFKEFFMAYFKYKKGDKVNIGDFTNPMTFAMFSQYIPKLDKMEDNYNKKTAANRENGKKGGRPKKDNTSDLTASNTPSGMSNQATKDNCSDGLKMTITREIPNEFAIPTPEIDEPVVDEGEIDDTGEYYDEWTDQCWSLIKVAKLDYMNGDYDAIKECNIKLSELMSICINNGCLEEKLLSIKCAVEKEVNEEIEREYNTAVMSA